MNCKPLASIIIIFYNAGERFFIEAIESIFAQTYNNWELLLADDGSTDESTTIALRYTKQYPEKVRYLEHDGHQNRGMSATRNLGIRHAKGEYIAFLDADDVWLPQKLEQQVAIMESHHQAGMVYGKAQYWYSWTGKSADLERDSIDHVIVATDCLYNSPILLLRNHPLIKNAGAPCPSDVLLRREVIDLVGGFEESFVGKYQYYEDQAFLSKLYLKTSVYISGNTWIKYRFHPNSCSSNVLSSGQDESVRLYFLNWLEKYLVRQNIKNVEVWKALKAALFPYRHPIIYKLQQAPKRLIREMKKSFKLVG